MLAYKEGDNGWHSHHHSSVFTHQHKVRVKENRSKRCRLCTWLPGMLVELGTEVEGVGGGRVRVPAHRRVSACFGLCWVRVMHGRARPFGKENLCCIFG